MCVCVFRERENFVSVHMCVGTSKVGRVKNQERSGKT